MEDRDGQLGVQQLCAASSLFAASAPQSEEWRFYPSMYYKCPLRRLVAMMKTFLENVILT
jgi:hypothetical protein